MSKQRKNETPSRTPSGLHIEIERAVRGSTDHQVSDTRARAQELALNALSLDDTSEQLELAVKAVVLDPRCTDALVILADIFEEVEDYIEAMYLITLRAAEDLGQEVFQQARGHFWEAVETRPYMRARLHLALALHEAGMNNQAIAEFEGILDLNANDNLGARFSLLALYFETGKLDLASSLLLRFPDDSSTQFAWFRLLNALISDDEAGARGELERARNRNKYVESYLTGRKHLPDRLPENYRPGDATDAIISAFEIHKAWEKYPVALGWLMEHEIPREKKERKGKR